ncbi:MAG TPA: hypothetical protein VEK39_02655 [Solirubrobacterales bacterium]|nr:hypothetical protein [Solirubrobacterales bacterium]
MSRGPGWLTLALAVAALAGPIGCGDSGGAPSGEQADAPLSEEQREEAERAEAAAQIAESDRIAYYQLATSSGLLRSFAIATRRGVDPRPGAEEAELRAAARRVATLEPDDKKLDRLAKQLDAALRAALAGSDDPAELLQASDAVNAGLERFVKRNPAASILVPD